MKSFNPAPEKAKLKALKRQGAQARKQEVFARTLYKKIKDTDLSSRGAQRRRISSRSINKSSQRDFVQATENQCPFCHIDSQRIVQQNTHGFVVRDGFPVSEGHSLIIPKRHVGSFFDLSVEEQQAMLELLNQCKQDLSTLSMQRTEPSGSAEFQCTEPVEVQYPDPSRSAEIQRTEPVEVQYPAGVRCTEPDPSTFSNRHSGLEPESITSQSEVKVPSSFNIGINDGPAAGQTVPHCHIHLIPRYKGDVEDSRGGVRWVLPDKADYWSGRK